MPQQAFFALMTVVALSVIAAEFGIARSLGRSWHDPRDTLANLNLAAGNLVMAVVWAGFIVWGYTLIHEHRIVDLPATLPGPAMWVVAYLSGELLQYWNHRLSHRWNVLWWGHITHHSSSHLNLSTGPRVNWFYRGMAWILYAPMPLMGFTIEHFIAVQAVMNVYNLLCHTRLHVPLGAVGWVFVTPAAHRLHHTSDPRFFGNYGASLIVWDRLFGTYRELPADISDEQLVWGIGANVDEGSLVRLNFHHLIDLWATAREEGRSFAGMLLGVSAPTVTVRAPSMARPLTPAVLAGFGLVAMSCVAVNQLTHEGPLVPRVVLWIGSLAAVTAFGALLQRRV